LWSKAAAVFGGPASQLTFAQYTLGILPQYTTADVSGNLADRVFSGPPHHPKQKLARYSYY